MGQVIVDIIFGIYFAIAAAGFVIALVSPMSIYQEDEHIIIFTEKKDVIKSRG